MRTEPERTGTPGGVGLRADLDGGRPLSELTAGINDLCDQVERRGERTVVALRLAPAPPGRPPWPGPVAIAEVNRWERAVCRLEHLDAATVIALDGACGGPVLDLLMAADFRLATPATRLVLPVTDGHFWPGMSLYRLVQHVGLARARRIVLWSTEIPVAEATDLGLVDRVSDDLAEAVHAAAVLCGRLSEREIRIRRRLLLEAVTTEYDDALGVHLAACDRELRRQRALSGPGEPR